MAIASATDYHFANVANIDISGEVLPEHPNDWRVNRGEDFAFIYEAFHEREVVSYKYDHAPSDWSNAEDYVKAHTRIAAKDRQFVVPVNLYDFLDIWDTYVSGGWEWSNGQPQERNWSGQGNYPGENPRDCFPDMYPASELGALLPSIKDKYLPWTVDLVRAAYNDMITRQFYVAKENKWFDNSAVTYNQVIRDSQGRTYTNTGTGWYWYASAYFDTYAYEQTTSSAPQPSLPPELGNSGGKMLTMWYVTGRRSSSGSSDYVAWYTKVTDVSENFTDLMSSLQATVPATYMTRSVSGSIIGYVVEASNMRTYLDISSQGSGT
jgi:hypothetical protein